MSGTEVITFGCRLNAYESEVALAALITAATILTVRVLRLPWPALAGAVPLTLGLLLMPTWDPR